VRGRRRDVLLLVIDDGEQPSPKVIIALD